MARCSSAGEEQPESERDSDVMVVSGEDGISTPLIVSPFNEYNGSLSPDGKWVAYQSNESGQNEIHVRPFPDVDSNQFVVSTDGGTHPVWVPGGGELFYVEGSRMMAVSVHLEPTFDYGPPEPIFSTDGYLRQAGSHSYDVAPDGRFLMIKIGEPGDTPTLPKINIVLNWFEELKALVPIP